jgi:hypothetical protein
MEKIDEYWWRLPREAKMRTDGIVFADEPMMASLRNDPGATAFPSVESQHFLWTTVWFRLEEWATISTEGCGSCVPGWSAGK